MFLPTTDHHVLLIRDRHQSLVAEAENERLFDTATSLRPGILRRLRRTVGKALIGLGRWVRGPQIYAHRRTVVSSS